jgi:hypothetical protein
MFFFKIIIVFFISQSFIYSFSLKDYNIGLYYQRSLQNTNGLLTINAGLGKSAPQYFYHNNYFVFAVGNNLSASIKSDCKFKYQIKLYDNSSILYGFLFSESVTDQAFSVDNITAFLHYQLGLKMFDYNNTEADFRQITFFQVNLDIFYDKRNYGQSLRISESNKLLEGFKFQAFISPNAGVKLQHFNNDKYKSFSVAQDYLGAFIGGEILGGVLLDNLYSLNLFADYEKLFLKETINRLSYGIRIFTIVPIQYFSKALQAYFQMNLEQITTNENIFRDAFISLGVKFFTYGKSVI